jgi:hypothetical protein
LVRKQYHQLEGTAKPSSKFNNGPSLCDNGQ